MNYGFKKGYSGAINTFECDVTTDGELDINPLVTGANIYTDGTPVKVEWTTGSGQVRGLYGIYDGSVDKVYYDPRVYTGDTISGGNIYQYAGSDVLQTRTYTLQSELTMASYSEAHLPYYASVDYTVVTPTLMGSYNNLMTLLVPSNVTVPADNSIVFVDRCNNYAYSVYPTTETVSSINDKFVSKLEFKVAKK